MVQMGNGCNRPAGSCLGDLEVLQVMQFWTNFVVSDNRMGHQNWFLSRRAVAVIPGCLELDICTCVNRRSRSDSGDR